MVSATQLSSFMYCPRKLFLKEVLLLEEPIKSELIKGLVWHITHEQINKNEERIVKSIKTESYLEIYDLYRKEYAKFLRNSIITKKTELKKFNINLIDIFKDYWPRFEEYAKARALNISNFISTHKVHGQELWDMLTPKILSEQYIKSEKMGLSGIIDIVEVFDDKYVPVELKTGKVPKSGMWDTHRVQLGAYMLLLEDSGKNVPEAVIRYKDADDDKRILVMNSMLKDEVLGLVKQVAALIKGFTLPEKTDNKRKCDKCSFKETCYDDKKIADLMKKIKNKP